MSQGLNRLQIIGDLTHDPELTVTHDRTASSKRLRFWVAVTDRRRVRDKWTEHVERFNVIAWDKPGEALAKNLMKGTRVMVEGSVRHASYENADGRHESFGLYADNVLVLGGAREHNDGAES